MRKFLLLIFLSVGLSQITFTDEEVKTLENQFLQLEVQVDSLSTQDSLKTIEIDLLEQKISLLEEDVAVYFEWKKYFLQILYNFLVPQINFLNLF